MSRRWIFLRPSLVIPCPGFFGPCGTRPVPTGNALNGKVGTGQRRYRTGGQQRDLDRTSRYRGSYAGFELGPTPLMSSKGGAEAVPMVVANVWLGRPSAAYVYGDILSGPLSIVSFPDRLRIEAGIQAGNLSRSDQCPVLCVDGRYRVGQTRLGFNGDACSEEVWRAGVSRGYNFKSDGG